jgi:hypothetical protein
VNRERWRQLQRALHPEDLVTVHRFAEALAVCEPFVFAYDGRLSMSIEGPAVRDLASAMIEDLTQPAPPGAEPPRGLQ